MAVAGTRKVSYKVMHCPQVVYLYSNKNGAMFKIILIFGMSSKFNM
jgi:hypothetical protein